MKQLLALLILLPGVIFGQGTTPTVQVKTVADLVALPIPVISTRLTAIVTGRLTTNDGFGSIFVYDPNSTASTNMGTIFKPATTTGRWTRQYAEPLNAGWFGATGWDATDDQMALTNAISVATNTTSGAVLEFPVGSFRHTGLIAVNNLTIQGQGQTLTRLLYVGTGSAISKGAATTVIERFGMRDIAVHQATDGQGGIGLDLDSFKYAQFENVTISTFRNAGDTGVGLRMLNTHGGCYFNRFNSLTIENCDTALLQDSSNAANATGFSYFDGMAIYQEKDCIQLKNTLAGGGSYNVFSGLQIQGNGANAGTGKVIYIEGVGNALYGVNVDQPGTNYVLEFNKTTTSGNTVEFAGGFDATKYLNSQSSGAANIVMASGYFTYSPGKKFTVADPLGQLDVNFQSAGSSGLDVQIGNATAGATAWRLQMQASATPYFRLGTPAGVVSEWKNAYHKFYITALEKMRVISTGVLIQPSNVSSDPVASAALEVRSTNQGILPPTMTSAERTAIATPADGLWLYQTDSTPAFYGRVNGVWNPFLTGASGAPIASPFVTAASDATLTGERTLTGTANQVILVDGGANSTMTLSLPQNIHTGASPTFVGMTLSGHAANRLTYFGVGGAITSADGLALINGAIVNSNAVDAAYYSVGTLNGFYAYDVGGYGVANTEYLAMLKDASAGHIFTEKNGTGTVRPLRFGTAGSGNTGLQVSTANRVTIGSGATTDATAQLMLVAGSATASTAPLKFNSGTVLGTPEAGAVEYDGTDVFSTTGAGRFKVARVLTGTATLDFDLTAVASQDLTITVTGAADGDSVSVGVPNGSVTADTLFWGWVSAGNTVTVRAMRIAGTPNPGSGTFKATVLKN